MEQGMLNDFCKRLCLILSISISPFVFANQDSTQSPKEVKKALLKVQNKMQKLEKDVYKSKREEKALIQQLATLDKEIGDSADDLGELQKTLHNHSEAVKVLQLQEAQLQHTTHAHQAALSKLMGATFAHYRKEKLQLLFEQQEWSSLSRQNQYYQYFYNARANQINELQNNLLKVKNLQAKIHDEKKEIQHLSQKLTQNQASLLEIKEKRHAVLEALSKKLATAQDSLSQLQQQEQHLSQVFKALQQKLPTIPSYVEPTQDFVNAKHTLKLPIQVKGAKLATLAHVTKSNAKKSYISAENGTPVNAIFGGRVVFAEWLRGLGLLIIVDHGNGYMSLYGNNQKLYKGLGDPVNQGEMIATVGQSGGHAEPGLYFEIRKDGEALDPSPWFTS